MFCKRQMLAIPLRNHSDLQNPSIIAPVRVPRVVNALQSRLMDPWAPHYDLSHLRVAELRPIGSEASHASRQLLPLVPRLRYTNTYTLHVLSYADTCEAIVTKP